MAPANSAPIIGIDLGTTNSVVAHVTGTPLRPELIAVDGQRICPSVVSFENADAPPLIGFPARNRLVVAPDATVRSAKRHMGTAHRYRIHGREFSPQEIQAKILTHLARAAESAMGATPARAVITVPAYFDQNQRQATREAGELAGLTVERLLNEPTAAALAHHPEGGVKQILVYDLGGGTFDASLVRMDGQLLEVLASHGDTHLGGDDFDLALAEWVLDGFVEIEADGDAGTDADELARAVRADAGAWMRLLLAAEAAKIELSSQTETVVRAEFLIEFPKGRPRHLEVPIERGDFIDLIAADLDRTLGSVQQVLDDASVTAADLDEVILVGGSTRIPAVWDLLHRELGLEPDRRIDPDICVGVGAAVQAGIIDGLPVGRVLVDVAPYSLGAAVLSIQSLMAGQPTMINRVITPRNTPLPSRFSERFHAIAPDQPRVEAWIFQGSDDDPTKNSCIGKIQLEGLRRRDDEELPSVIIEFAYDLSGQVTAHISNPGSGRRGQETIHVDGLDSRDRMTEYLADCRRDSVSPGYSAKIGAGAETATKAASEAAGESPDEIPAEFADDDRVLRQVMRKLDELSKKHPASAADLKRAVADARHALHDTRPVDRGRARQTLDTLTDLLFDLGEFF